MTSVYDPDDDEARPLTNGNGKHHHRSATRPSLCERMATPVLLAAILVVTALAPGREPASTEAVLPPPPPAPPAPPFPQWHKLDGAAADAPVGVWWDDNGDAALLIGQPQDAGGMAAIEIGKDKVDTGYQMLLVNYVTKGVGVHNAYDSGLPSGTKLVEFRKAGPKIQLVALPAQHRALSDDPNVVAGVGRSFAESVLWTFDIAHDFGGGYILDATGYMLRNWDDSTDFIAGLKRGYGADYTLDRTRSAVVQDRSKATPEFSCLEADLTYVAAENPAGPLGRALATSHAVTVSVRVSFVAIPQEGDDDFYPLRQQHPKSSKTFDPLAPAEVVAGLVFDMLLEPGRAGRLALQSDYDPTLPTLVEVLDACSNAVLGTSSTPMTSTLSTHTELSTAYVVASVYLHRLLELITYGSFRVAGAVTDAIDSAGMRLSAAAADPSLAGTGRELDWAYLAEKARAGQPFMDRVLPIPDGAPI